MYGFAVAQNGSWRAVASGDDCLPGETFRSDAPAVVAPDAWAALRADRDRRLSDAVAILDRHRNQGDFGLATTLADEQARAWAVYAQALRDLPENTTDPANPSWPEVPQ